MAGIRPSDLRRYCPAELSNSHWQKAKGKVGKMIKTGVGAELKKFEAMFKKIDFMALDPASNPSKSLEELAKKVLISRKEYAKSVEPLRKQLFVIRGKAEAAETKFKATKLGANAAKSSAVLAKAAGNFAVSCKSLDLQASIDKVKADIDKKNALAAKLLSGSLKKYVIGAKAFLADPTEPSWEKNIKQQGRSVSNSVAQLQAYRANFWKDFEKFKGFDTGTLKISKDPQFSKKATFVVKKSLVQIKAIASFKA